MFLKKQYQGDLLFEKGIQTIAIVPIMKCLLFLIFYNRHVENLILIPKNNQPFFNYLQKNEYCYLTFQIPEAKYCTANTECFFQLKFCQPVLAVNSSLIISIKHVLSQILNEFFLFKRETELTYFNICFRFYGNSIQTEVKRKIVEKSIF